MERHWGHRYNSRYSPGDLCRSVFASSDQQIVERPVYASGDLQFHDHKGFNWRLLRSMLQSALISRAPITSPVPWLPPSMASQVWFVLKKELLNRYTDLPSKREPAE